MRTSESEQCSFGINNEQKLGRICWINDGGMNGWVQQFLGWMGAWMDDGEKNGG